jgi:hypothetical protein
MSALRTPILVAALGAALVLPAFAAPQDRGNNLLTIDFPGGTVADYVASIRKQSPDSNILLMADAEVVPVPAMRLRNVTLGAAIQILDPLVLENEMAQVRLGTDVTHNPPGEAVWSIVARAKYQKAPSQTAVIAVGHVLAGEVDAESLLTAIETGLSLFGEQYQRPEMRFHEPTGLIIARGHPQQVSMINDVVNQIYENIKSSQERRLREQSMIDAEQKISALEAELSDTVSELTAYRVEIKEVQTQADVIERQLHQSLEGLAARDREVVTLQTQLADARARLDGRKEPK